MPPFCALEHQEASAQLRLRDRKLDGLVLSCSRYSELLAELGVVSFQRRDLLSLALKCRLEVTHLSRQPITGKRGGKLGGGELGGGELGGRLSLVIA